jgi:hypothetical protein
MAVTEPNSPWTNLYLMPRHADDNFYGLINEITDYAEFVNTNGSGMYIITRVDSTHFNAYKNNTKNVNTGTSTALPYHEIYLLARNVLDSPGTFSNQEIALVVIGAAFNDTDVADFNTVFVDGYLNSVGAKI